VKSHCSPYEPTSRATRPRLRDEVAQLHHLLHQTRELHASEAAVKEGGNSPRNNGESMGFYVTLMGFKWF